MDARMNAAASFRTVDDFCERNNCSYDALAEKLDVSRATIFNWRKDLRGLPRIVVLALVALENDFDLMRLSISGDSRPAEYTITSGVIPALEIESFCKGNDYSYGLLSEELKVSRATIFNWKNASRRLPPRIALLALMVLERMPELRTVKKPSAEHAGRKQYRRGSVMKLKG
jgi:DNA-binding transcriptional regulator YiaG